MEDLEFIEWPTKPPTTTTTTEKLVLDVTLSPKTVDETTTEISTTIQDILEAVNKDLFTTSTTTEQAFTSTIPSTTLAKVTAELSETIFVNGTTSVVSTSPTVANIISKTTVSSALTTTTKSVLSNTTDISENATEFSATTVTNLFTNITESMSTVTENTTTPLNNTNFPVTDSSTVYIIVGVLILVLLLLFAGLCILYKKHRRCHKVSESYNVKVTELNEYNTSSCKVEP